MVCLPFSLASSLSALGREEGKEEERERNKHMSGCSRMNIKSSNEMLFRRLFRKLLTGIQFTGRLTKVKILVQAFWVGSRQHSVPTVCRTARTAFVVRAVVFYLQGCPHAAGGCPAFLSKLL